MTQPNLKEIFDTDGKKKSPRLLPPLKNYIIDIDGVISEDVPNEEPERMATAAEIPGAKEKINKLYDEGNIITFFTARTLEHKKRTEKWLAQHGFKYHNILYNKPRGGRYHYIDDGFVGADEKI